MQHKHIWMSLEKKNTKTYNKSKWTVSFALVDLKSLLENERALGTQTNDHLLVFCQKDKIVLCRPTSGGGPRPRLDTRGGLGGPSRPRWAPERWRTIISGRDKHPCGSLHPVPEWAETAIQAVHSAAGRRYHWGRMQINMLYLKHVIFQLGRKGRIFQHCPL